MKVILKFLLWPALPRIILPEVSANSPLLTQSQQKGERGQGNTKGKHFLKVSGRMAVNSYQVTHPETPYKA